MADDLTGWHRDRPFQWLIFLMGAHSCALGLAMLVAPRPFLQIFWFPPPDHIFFPSQSGLFLIILGLCYVRAVNDPSFVRLIVVSKSLAVVFLLTHLAFFSAPAIIWAAAAVDGGFLLATLSLMRRHGGMAAAFPDGPLGIRKRDPRPPS